MLAGLALVLGGIPVLYAVLPAARDVRLAGVPVVWPVLAVLVYPVLVAVAAWYTRAATRVERRLSATAQER